MWTSRATLPSRSLLSRLPCLCKLVQTEEPECVDTTMSLTSVLNYSANPALRLLAFLDEGKSSSCLRLSLSGLWWRLGGSPGALSLRIN